MLPCCKPCIIRVLRKSRHYPKELNTLGDHIRIKRLDLDLEQKEVALLFKINHETIKNWENNNTKPGIKYYPAIMNFLGYCPYVRPETWGEELKLHRIHQGLSHRRLSKIIDVDPCTIGYWEKGGNPTWEGKGKRGQVSLWLFSSKITSKGSLHIQSSILNGFGNMVCLDILTPFHISDCSGDLEYTVVSSC